MRRDDAGSGVAASAEGRDEAGCVALEQVAELGERRRITAVFVGGRLGHGRRAPEGARVHEAEGLGAGRRVEVSARDEALQAACALTLAVEVEERQLVAEQVAEGLRQARRLHGHRDGQAEVLDDRCLCASRRAARRRWRRRPCRAMAARSPTRSTRERLSHKTTHRSMTATSRDVPPARHTRRPWAMQSPRAREDHRR